MYYKIFIILSLFIILFTFNISCAPTFSQSDYDEMRFRVQSLNDELVQTQFKLQSTQNELANVNQRIAQLREQTAQKVESANVSSDPYIYTYYSQSSASSYYPYCYSPYDTGYIPQYPPMPPPPPPPMPPPPSTSYSYSYSITPYPSPLIGGNARDQAFADMFLNK
jgi:hypothetical protein